MSIIGLGFIGAAAAIFVYCTVWIFVTPYLNISVLTIGPHILLLIALSGLAAFLLKSAAAKKKKQ